MRADFGLCGGAFDASARMVYAASKLDEIDRRMRSKGYRRN